MKMKDIDGREALRETFRVLDKDIDGSISNGASLRRAVLTLVEAKTDFILNKFILVGYYFPSYQNK